MADLRIHQDALRGVSDSDQRRIEDILKNTGLLAPQDRLVSHAGAADALDFSIKFPKIPNPLCKLGCNAAEAAAVAACAALSGPAAAACIVAAHTAADYCRSRC
jgi:hypothetical protein